MEQCGQTSFYIAVTRLGPDPRIAGQVCGNLKVFKDIDGCGFEEGDVRADI
ncbi:hypothetical protein M7I_2745 [Glarea lozoyensis 74030]|uniref:Uncharacterized protein n=1 Tax=Glarea lozoyensis (strain ATCC 74030 / MF5533) TaxID=1104152 RepID=H0EJL7_GLAL7|nr:hypothetical protein M7I_2745 [Glarea lozoyensis 74030]